MGFRLDRVYNLKFEGAMEGAWVKIRSTPLGVALQLRGGISAFDAVGLLAQYVVDWNLEDQIGDKIAFTQEAIMNALEEVVVAKILIEWYKAAAGVTAPLDPPGTEGDFEETEIPMETNPTS